MVSGSETAEVHRQARVYRNTFATAERKVDLYMFPEVDHFDELNALADPESEFFKRALVMLGL